MSDSRRNEDASPNRKHLQSGTAAGSPTETGLEALYLLIPGDASRACGSAATAAMAAAKRFAKGRGVLLLDLDPSEGGLTKVAGTGNAGGLAEALEKGLSPRDAGLPITEGIRFVAIGRNRSGDSGLLGHPDLPRFLAAAALLEMRILAYLPADENLAGMASLASGAILLAGRDEELMLRARLPASLRVVGVIEPQAHSGSVGPPSDQPFDRRREPGPVVTEPKEAFPREVASDGSFASILRAARADLEDGSRPADGA